MSSSSREAGTAPALPVPGPEPDAALPGGSGLPGASAPSVAELRRRVLRLAGPICAALVVGALAQLVVAALLGHMGDDALYVRSLFIPVTFLVLAVQEGLDVSTQVGFARLRGARGRDDVPSSATAALLGRFVAAGGAVLGAVALLVVLAAPALATVLSVPGPLVAEFVAFARWTVLASVLSVPTAVAAAALRGWGRTGASATVALLVAGLQVLVVWLVGLVGGFGFLAVPVAIAGSTLVGAGVAWALLVRARLLPPPGRRMRGAARPGAADHRGVDVRALLLGVGLPVGLSYLLLTVTNLVMVWVLGPSGTDVVAGFGGAATVQTLVVVPAIGLAAAVSIVMNQQWGAGALGLLPRTFRAGTVVVAGTYVVVGALVLAAAPLLAGQLSTDPEVAAQAALYLRVVGPSYAGVGLVLYLVTLLEQLGYGRVAVTLNVLYHAVSLGVGGALARAGGGPTALYATIAVANVVGLAVLLPVAVRLVRRRAGGGRARQVTS
ncbi:MATE family efflux transporter [Cellulosimicrobium sp. TH-20]|uniref:MATE family efflux transporter n=1 Tax=Cellulosimicrobium sp. TH-20 TaxID=1980001 RepID=UPI0011A77773|nr:MATE family efflux transporter [Cellulosimicrobium sp. TH-20]